VVAVVPTSLLSFLVKVFAIFYPNAIANAAASSSVATRDPAIFMLPVAVTLPDITLPVTLAKPVIYTPVLAHV
jgi:hypothetical protein